MRAVFVVLVVFCFAKSVFGVGKTVQLAVGETITQECPNVKSQDVLKENVTMEIVDKYSVLGTNNLHVISQQGETKTITFPGCYDVKMTIKLKRPLRNPYSEVYMQLGRELPCRKPTMTKDEICGNASLAVSEWCPRSTNAHIKALGQKDTCHFCNLCKDAKQTAGQEKTHKFFKVQSGGIGEDCTLDNPYQPYTLSFELCTPSEADFEEWDKDGFISRYWEFLKHGSLTMVVHLMERSNLDPNSQRVCLDYCRRWEEQQPFLTDPVYRKLFRDQLEKACTPRDDYVTCQYSTMQFTVQSNFD